MRERLKPGEAYGCGWDRIGNDQWQWHAYGPTGTLTGVTKYEFEAEAEAIAKMDALYQLTPISVLDRTISNAGAVA